MSRKKTKKPKVDWFAFFRQTVNETLEPLFTEFSFRHVETLEHMPDCVLKYRNETTGIDVRYEWKSRLGVSLVKFERRGSEVIEASKYDFLFLLEIRKPSIDLNEFYGSDKEWTEAHIEQLLRKYATHLKENARDVLTGDFSIFPELKKLTAANRRKWNKETFGTSSGESARFSTRPTLEQVFAGAKDVDPALDRFFGRKLNQDKTDARIYEAYWDHQYSVREIADYLNETEEWVQQQLDEWDDHG